jgi:uncharacterized phage protein (TIGR02218 family)
MKSLASSLLSALSAEVRTVTRCLKITRRDGEIFAFTEFDRDLTIDGLTYRSREGLTPSAIAFDLDFQANNFEFTGLISDDGIAESDLRLGLFDYARVNLFLVNYLDLPSSLTATPPKHLALPVRVMGKVSHTEGDFTAELLGLSGFLAGRSGWSTSRTCRYDLGDSFCGVDVASFKQTLTVNNSIEPLSFFATSTPSGDRYTGGKITFLSGNNEGLTVGVIKQNGNRFYLPAPLPFPVTNGDTFDAFPNCQKRLEDCRSFNNRANFGGEDEIPGLDAYISQEDQG